jgi:hypothetical protein
MSKSGWTFPSLNGLLLWKAVELLSKDSFTAKKQTDLLIYI